MTSLMVLALTMMPAHAGEDDPEPPVKAGLVARLVAKKTTYKLDLKGSSVEEYEKAAALGRAPAVPVEVDLVIVNRYKKPVRVRLTAAATLVTLSLKGKGVVEAESEKKLGKGPKLKIDSTVLQPGERLTIPITALASTKGGRVLKTHYWTAPGEYTLSASLSTRVEVNYDPNEGGELRNETIEARPVTLTVEK